MSFRTDYDWTEVVQPITDEEVRQWTAALRSGNYTQGYTQLRRDDCFCCLGVANEVFKLGLPDSRGILADEYSAKATRLPEVLQQDLYEINDRREWSFSEIADYIDKGFGIG